MYTQTALAGVKSEQEFLWAAVRRSVLILIFTTLVSVIVVGITVHAQPESVQRQALITSFILPLLIAPPSLFYTSRQGLQNHRLMLEVTRLAHTDEMTGLANRRSFIREADEQLVDAGLEDKNLCLFIIDIDHFKAVNDKYGHSAGDETLIHVTTQMRAAIPEGTLIARLGGEEFAILMPFGSLADIQAQAEALRSVVADSPCVIEGHKISVTISVGAGIAGPDDTISSLLSRADCALYAAKNEGRNRFSIAA